MSVLGCASLYGRGGYCEAAQESVLPRSRIAVLTGRQGNRHTHRLQGDIGHDGGRCYLSILRGDSTEEKMKEKRREELTRYS